MGPSQSPLCLICGVSASCAGSSEKCSHSGCLHTRITNSLPGVGVHTHDPKEVEVDRSVHAHP